MAEVLGIVAGFAGIAGLAIQITETVQKLKSFVTKTGAAHRQLEDLLDELDLLATLISQSDQSEFFTDVDNRSRAPLYCCEKAARNISSVLNNVQTIFEGHEMRGVRASLRLVLKEKQIEESLRKLERAKSMLLLAKQYIFQ